MKKRILSIVLVLSMIISFATAIPLSAGAQSEINVESKKLMEEYMTTLIQPEYVKYAQSPFDEYNDAVEEHVMNKNIVWEAFIKVFNDLGSSSYEEALATILGQSTFSKKEFYNVFSDYLSAVVEESEPEEYIKDYDENVDFLVDYNKTALIAVDAIDDISEQTEIKKIYEQTHQAAEDSKKFFGDVNKGLNVVKYYDKMMAIGIRDYSRTSKYIDVMCDYIEEEAKSIREMAEINNDESMKTYANDMIVAMSEIKLSYYNKFLAAFGEVGKTLINDIKKYAQDAMNQKLTDIGAGSLVGIFKAVNSTLFIKDLVMNIEDMNEKIDASSKIQASYPLTLGLQNEFYKQSKKRLADGEFSDEDYRYMKTLFELCRGAQTSNYKYLDTQSGQSWIDSALKDLDITNSGHITDESYMKKYIDYAKGYYDTNENVNEIDGVYENHSYKFINTPMDYYDAKRYCESVGGYFAVINSEEELNYLHNIRNTLDYYQNNYFVEYNAKERYPDRTHGMVGRDVGGWSTIMSGESEKKYYEAAEYIDNGGFRFICEWDEYKATEQTIKKHVHIWLGENVSGFVDYDGTFYIRGEGSMYGSIKTDEEFENPDKIIEENTRPSLPGSLLTSRPRIQKVIFEGNITTIGKSAIGGQIREITLPDSIISIGESAFDRCGGLETVNMSSKCKYIGELAFAGCEFKNIDLPDSIKKIGDNAFLTCHNLREINIPDSVEYIGRQAFFMSGLEKVSLSKNIKEFKPYAFQSCSKLKEVKIPEGIEELPLGAFEGSIVENFVIPKSVKKIGGNALASSELKNIYILNPNCEIGTNTYGIYLANSYKKVNVYGYSNSTAQKWVEENPRQGIYFYEFIPITDETVIPNQPKQEENKDLGTTEDKKVYESEYVKSQKYIEALNVGTDEAMEDYLLKYENGDMNPNIKMYADTDEFRLDIYQDETFTLNYKTAYLDESDMMKSYKDKKHYVMIEPEGAMDLDECYHYQVDGDGTGFKYNALPVGNYIAYVRTDLSGEIGNDLAVFNITVHDLVDDNIDDELQTAMDFLKENGAMEGYPDGSFRPNKSMTRAEFAAIVCRYTNNDIEFTGENDAFDDVFNEDWSYNYIMNAYEKGLFKGYGNGVFGSDDTLTEEQAVTVLCRMLSEFYDDVDLEAEKFGAYSKGYIKIAEDNKIYIQTEDKAPATRAKVAKWLYQLYNIKNA